MATSLLSVNSAFESGAEDPPATIWNEWLWESDLAEPVTVDCMLNRSHLLGLLIARYRALREPELMNVCISVPNMTYSNTRVSVMTPRQLQDTLQDLQMHWARYVDEIDPSVLLELTDAVMARFGHFCTCSAVYDDVSMRDSSDAGRMSLPCIRRFVSTLVVLYRHLDLMDRCTPPPCVEESPELVQDYHVQASMEAFYKHTMHADLPPAAKLLYRQDFAGFYHCVSQVVYFHFPSYERKVQLKLDAIRSGMHPVHTLAPLMEMYPEIELCYEDEVPAKGRWTWILMCGGRVYLTDGAERTWFDTNMLRLMGAYVHSVASGA